MNKLKVRILTELTYIDKSDWPEGPWSREPDKISWVDNETSYACYIRRVDRPMTGNLCGYVGVNESHPLYRVDCKWSDNLKVHGDVTFSDFMDDCSDGLWWIGFDCLHGSDIIPQQPYQYSGKDREYRDVYYVISEVESLAKQLKEKEIKQ